MKIVKIATLVSIVVMLSCTIEKKMEDCTIQDLGKIQIGDDVYLKKLQIGRGWGDTPDRVYILVDSNDKLVSSNTTVNSQDGKVKISKTIISK